LLDLFFNPEDGGNMFLWNVCWLSVDYTEDNSATLFFHSRDYYLLWHTLPCSRLCKVILYNSSCHKEQAAWITTWQSKCVSYQIHRSCCGMTLVVILWSLQCEWLSLKYHFLESNVYGSC
jgi:hypothetical protein